MYMKQLLVIAVSSRAGEGWWDTVREIFVTDAAFLGEKKNSPRRFASALLVLR